MQNHSAPHSTLPGYFSPLPPPHARNIPISNHHQSFPNPGRSSGSPFSASPPVQGLGWKGRLIFTDVNREDLIKENFWLAFYI